MHRFSVKLGEALHALLYARISTRVAIVNVVQIRPGHLYHVVSCLFAVIAPCLIGRSLHGPRSTHAAARRSPESHNGSVSKLYTKHVCRTLFYHRHNYAYLLDQVLSDGLLDAGRLVAAASGWRRCHPQPQMLQFACHMSLDFICRGSVGGKPMFIAAPDPGLIQPL